MNLSRNWPNPACENAGVMEVIRPGLPVTAPKVVIFDFDGTLSVIRSGWMEVMIPLCVEQLTILKTGESENELTRVVDEFVWTLTGKETIYQMRALCAAIQERGGKPLEPLAYKRMYLERLGWKIGDRLESLRRGTMSPDTYFVPGARQFLEDLTQRGMLLYLASGTDDANVKEEAALLDLARFFPGRIFGAHDDGQGFSKAELVKRILSQTTETRHGLIPDELLVFGDGYVEIEEVKKAGGIAGGLATAEPECQTIDPWKRRRLIAAGADFILPNFLQLDHLNTFLFETAEVAQN